MPGGASRTCVGTLCLASKPTTCELFQRLIYVLSSLASSIISALATAHLSARAIGFGTGTHVPSPPLRLSLLFLLRRAHHQGIAALTVFTFSLPVSPGCHMSDKTQDTPMCFTCGRRRLAPSPSVLPAPCRRALPCRYPQSVHHLLRLLPRTSWAGWGRAPRR